MYNPMCCISPRWGCLVFGILGTIMAIMWAYYCLVGSECYGVMGGSTLWWIIGIIIMICLIVAMVFLLIGSIKEDGDKIKIAFLILVIWTLVSAIIILINKGFKGLLDAIVYSLGWLFCLFIVFAYYLETGGSAPICSGLDYCSIEKVV